MDDEHLDDRVADEIRGRLMREVVADRERTVRSGRPAAARTRTPWFPVLTSIAVAVVVVAVSIAVLLAAPKPQPADPKPTQTQVFGGSCGSLLGSGDVRAAVGARVGRPADITRAQADGASSQFASLFALGGLECAWSSTKGGHDQASLVLAAAPVALAPKKLSPIYCYGSSAGGPVQTTCTFNRRSHGLWYSGLLTAAKGGPSVVKARIPALAAALAASAAEPGASIPLPKRAPHTWAHRTDCAALVRVADLATVLHSPGLAGDSGNGTSEPTDGQIVARDHLGATACMLSTNGSGGRWRITSLDIAVFPGAASVRRLVDADPSARVVRTASGRRVVVTKDTDGVVVLHAFDGPNYLQVMPDRHPVSQVLRAVDPLLRVLDAKR
jgi:hypothetical protein